MDHALERQDLTELRLHEANLELAKGELERLDGVSLVEFMRVERPPNEETGEEREPLIVWGLSGPVRPAVADAYHYFLRAQFRCLAYTRWYASNGPVKRTTSEFVRSRRPGLDAEIPQAILDGLISDDYQVQGSAWGKLARGF
jgi:hypothetical protein